MQVILSEAGIQVDDETNVVDKFMTLPDDEKKQALLEDFEMYVLLVIIQCLIS